MRIRSILAAAAVALAFGGPLAVSSFANESGTHIVRGAGASGVLNPNSSVSQQPSNSDLASNGVEIITNG